MFHFAPRHPHTAQLSPFDSLPYTSSPYDAYDARRSHLEQLALAQRQQERREAEEALLRRRQQELAIEKEVERRRIAAYQAALEQQIYDELEEQRQRRAQQQAVLREERRRQALEEEHRRKILAARQQEEFLRRRQEQARRQQTAEPDQQQEQADTDSFEAHLQPFLQLLFGSQPTPQPTSTTSASPSPPSTEVTVPTTSAAPTSEPLPEPSPSPSAVEESPATDTTITSAAEKLQRHYRTHLHRREALSTLAALASSLDIRQSEFTLPSTLTFQPSPPSSTTDDQSTTLSGPTPKLAFQSSNAPFLAYEDFLVSLLSKIDAVSSGGDRTVKQARKQLVKRVDSELSRLDEARESAWAREQSSKTDAESVQVSAPSVEKQQVDVTADSDDLSLVRDSALSSPAAVKPSSTPLPVDDSSKSQSPSDDVPTLLTSATLASVPSSPSVAKPSSTPRPESVGSSDAGSDETLSVDDSDVDAAISDIVRQAHKLGEEVVMLEKVELGAVEEAEKAAEDFVVV